MKINRNKEIPFKELQRLASEAHCLLYDGFIHHYVVIPEVDGFLVDSDEGTDTPLFHSVGVKVYELLIDDLSHYGILYKGTDAYAIVYDDEPDHPYHLILVFDLSLREEERKRIHDKAVEWNQEVVEMVQKHLTKQESVL
jgi:hypothetical protein